MIAYRCAWLRKPCVCSLTALTHLAPVAFERKFNVLFHLVQGVSAFQQVRGTVVGIDQVRSHDARTKGQAERGNLIGLL